MSVAWMLAVLSGFPADQPVEAPVPSGSPSARRSAVSANRLQTRDELRAAYSHALQNSTRKVRPDPHTVVPKLVKLYSVLADVDALSHRESSRMRRGLKNRLEEIRDRVIREELKRQRMSRRGGRHSRRAPAQAPTSGGGEAARAAELVELIQTTIAPESWDVNGGKGSIYYFSLLRVLVVRQTGEVHHQVGNSLPQLKK